MSSLPQPHARVAELIRNAFAGVRLGNGVGLWEGQGIDDYADARTIEGYRARDEKDDWSQISASELDRCSSSLSFIDAAGMRFHLPAYLLADLSGALSATDILFTLVQRGRDAEHYFHLLSLAQRAAVREFLQLRLADANYELDQQRIAHALQGYWATEKEVDDA